MPAEVRNPINSSFVDRGTRTVVDYDIPVLVVDDNFHSVDMSAKVPLAAKAVLFTVLARATGAGNYCQIRKVGNGFNFSEVRSQVANVFIRQEMIIGVENATMEVRIQAGGVWNVLNFYIKGWFL